MTTREEYIAGLRSLADFLEGNPAVPTEAFPGSIMVHAFGEDDEAERALVDAAAQAMGVVAGGGSHYAARREFGPFAYEVTSVSRAFMAEYNEIAELARREFEARRAAAVEPSEPGVAPGGCRVTVVAALDGDESVIGCEAVVTEQLETGAVCIRLDGEEGSRLVSADEVSSIHGPV